MYQDCQTALPDSLNAILGGLLRIKTWSKNSADPIEINFGYGLLIGISTVSGGVSVYMCDATSYLPILGDKNIFTITRIDEYHMSIGYNTGATFIGIGM